MSEIGGPIMWSSSANDLLEHTLFGTEAATKAQSGMNARSHGRSKRSGRSGFGSWLPSVLYGMAEKVIEVQYYQHTEWRQG